MIAQLRAVLFRKPRAPMQALHGRTFIVTGCAANSIGYATAKALLEWGAEVTITRRSDSQRTVQALASEVPAAKDRLFARDLELADAISVKSFAAWYIAERKTLDVLINNAGIHLDLLSRWKEPNLTADQHEIHWRTNYLGTSQLTHALLPLLEYSAASTGDARIVNVISMLHSRGKNSEFFTASRPYNSWDAYGQSKLALLHFTKALQQHYGEKGLTAYCLHPGEVYTNIAAKGLSGNPVIESVRNFFWPIERLVLMTAEEGAQTSLLCATAPNLLGGEYYRDCRVAEASAEAADQSVRQALWKANQEWLASVS